MFYVVEIVGPGGGRAQKQYDAESFRTALGLAKRDLVEFPGCKITNIRGTQGDADSERLG